LRPGIRNEARRHSAVFKMLLKPRNPLLQFGNRAPPLSDLLFRCGTALSIPALKVEAKNL
jgi:hypothetical protein